MIEIRVSYFEFPAIIADISRDSPLQFIMYSQYLLDSQSIKFQFIVVNN